MRKRSAEKTATMLRWSSVQIFLVAVMLMAVIGAGIVIALKLAYTGVTSIS